MEKITSPKNMEEWINILQDKQKKLFEAIDEYKKAFADFEEWLEADWGEENI